MPRPPCERSSERSACVNRSKMRGSSFAVDADPRVAHAQDQRVRCPVGRSSQTSMRPPSSVYLAALLSRFTTTCSSRVGSACTQTGSRAGVTVSSCLRLLDQRAGRSRPRARTTLRSGPGLHGAGGCVPLATRETSSRSSTSWVRLRHLPLDDLAGLLLDRVLAAVLLEPQQVHGVADRGQRVAQLVGEHRQELVLAAVQVGQGLGLLPDLLLQPAALGDVADVALDDQPVVLLVDVADELDLDRLAALVLQRQVLVADVAVRPAAPGRRPGSPRCPGTGRSPRVPCPATRRARSPAART